MGLGAGDLQPRRTPLAAAALLLVLLGALLLLVRGMEDAPLRRERLLLSLRSLGRLRERKPGGPRAPAAPVPPLLWKIFQKRAAAAAAAPAAKAPRRACWVDEFNVRGNVLRVFADQGGFIHRGEPQSGLCLQKRLYFNLSALEDGEEVTLAQLRLTFGHNSYRGADPEHPYELSLFRASQMTLRGMPARPSSRKRLVGQSFIHLHRAFAFDLTQVARDWQVASKNFGLILEIGVPTLPDRKLCPGLDSFLDASLLVVSLAPKECASLRKRRSVYYSPVSISNVCKPRQLYISFSDVGWENWIIAPQGYMANYCLGECPFPLTEELNSTNHAILQTMVHSLDPEGTPQPCCVPVHLSPISILYYDNDDNVVLRHYEDMVVDECGCR
ncbi:embryonic growth/differentiation factor 1 [Hemicordylus capensis]|uniref:embryonic growth/differentiation factor 1 n=1 Tax=Hemicordylus capensis TaxID=884348 RepID=UPI00230387AB|nr:embryonic growth/differentiation factor 1 [Hemicordylus capensis]